MNLTNLKLFRDGFQKLMDDGIVTQETFDMQRYRSNKDGSHATFNSIHDCGTVGCFLGWAPFIKGLEFNYQQSLSFYSGWVEYFNEVFFDETLEGVDEFFEFLFSDEWECYDNTPEGALARLDVLLSGDFKYLDKHFNEGEIK